MKKKLVSLVLAVAVVFSMCVPAFATTGFNQSVFEKDRDNVVIDTDDMDGTTFVRSFSFIIGDTSLSLGNSSFVMTDPAIFITDSFDLFSLRFVYLGTDLLGANGVTIKIGDNRYSFSNCTTSHSITDDGRFQETILFCMKNETKKFMSDLKDHRNDEIKVRLSGSQKNLDFILTDGMKNSLLDLYDLYVAGGGTRDKNMHNITLSDSVVVTKNGEVIDGLVKEKMVDAGFQILGALSSIH